MQHLTKNKFYCFLILVLVIISCNQFLYIEGLKYDNFNETEFEPMADAADDGDCERLRELMATGKYDINQMDSVWGSTLLKIAVAHSDLDVTRCLLDLGADPNHAGFRSGSSAGSIAVQDFGDNCDTAMLHLLLQYGMDVNFVERGHIDWDPNKPIGPQYSLLRLSMVQCHEITKFLCDHGVDLNYSPDSSHLNALSEAIIHRNMVGVEYLLIEKKADFIVCVANENIPIDTNYHYVCVSTIDYLNGINCSEEFVDCNKVEKLKKYILDHPEQARYIEVPKGK